MLRHTLLFSLVLTAPVFAAPVEWTSETAIMAAQEACPKEIRFETWTATLQGENWEVRGVTADKRATAVATYRSNRTRPIMCGVILEGLQSRFLRPL